MSVRSTKETHRDVARHPSLYFFIVLFFCLLLGAFSECFYVNAATLSIHNHVTNDTYDYTDASVHYIVNGEAVATEYPGLILSNGAAVGPFSALFEEKLGVSSDYVDGKNSFSVSYGPHTIKLTLGNTEAIVNGIKKNMTNPPFVYSFDNKSEKYLYVPTRFIAEALGFEYAWDAAVSTVSITRPNVIYDGKTQLKYTGINPTFLLNNITISSEVFPGYVLDETVLFSAEEYFKNTGIAAYAYAEGSGLILLKSGNCLVRMVLDSPIAYINDTAYLLSCVPRLITPHNSSKAGVYIPAEFVARAFGYDVSYDNKTGILRLNGALPSGKDSTEGDLPLTDSFSPDVSSFGNTIFSYKTHPQIISHYTEKGYRVPAEMSAYSCKNSDALYLKGIEREKVQITDKCDLLEITVSGYFNPFEGEVAYSPDADFLNYCYFRGENTFKIIVIKRKELLYYTYDAPNGCVIHFTDMSGMYEDSLKFAGFSDFDSVGGSSSDASDIFSGTDFSDYLPEAVFPRDYFVIRLPEGVTPMNVTDSDEYEKKRFTVSIPGNHMSFLSEQDTYNPVPTLKNVQFSYKVATDTTVITFNTTKIQGYSYTVAGGFLAVKIANPSEIYDKIIVLDAGHGGIDPGTLRGSVYEKTVNFNVTNVYAKEYFKDSDIKVYYTRTTDTKIALQTRADFAATVEADLFISFHVNAHSNSAVNGTSVYYSTSNNKPSASGLKSSVLANSIVTHLSKEWGTKNNGILSDKFVVIHKNSVPAVLVECGFITNNNDFQKIKDTSYQKKAAKALFDAVSEIFEKYPTKR